MPLDFGYVAPTSGAGYNRGVLSSITGFLVVAVTAIAQMIGLPQNQILLAGTPTEPIIINNSSHWILAYTIADQNGAGPMRPRTYDMIGQLRNNPRAGIAPGISFSEAQSFTRPEIRDAKGTPPPAPTQVTLDSVLFDNGVLVGPDKMNTFDAIPRVCKRNGTSTWRLRRGSGLGSSRSQTGGILGRLRSPAPKSTSATTDNGSLSLPPKCWASAQERATRERLNSPLLWQRIRRSLGTITSRRESPGPGANSTARETEYTKFENTNDPATSHAHIAFNPFYRRRERDAGSGSGRCRTTSSGSCNVGRRSPEANADDPAGHDESTTHECLHGARRSIHRSA